MPLHDNFPLKSFAPRLFRKAQTCNTEVTTQMVQNVCKSVYLDLIV